MMMVSEQKCQKRMHVQTYCHPDDSGNDEEQPKEDDHLVVWLQNFSLKIKTLLLARFLNQLIKFDLFLSIFPDHSSFG